MKNSKPRAKGTIYSASERKRYRNIPARRRMGYINSVAIDSLESGEKIILFQQLEIAQGLRKGTKTMDGLSQTSRKIIMKYDCLRDERQKNMFAERVKNQIFNSVKKSLAQD